MNPNGMLYPIAMSAGFVVAQALMILVAGTAFPIVNAIIIAGFCYQLWHTW